MNQGIPDWMTEVVDGAIVFDDCEDAIVGYGTRPGQDPLIVYDYDLLLDIQMRGGLDLQDAIEYVDYNIVGLWAGDRTPIILYRPLDAPK
jgi:hypothetical protein